MKEIKMYQNTSTEEVEAKAKELVDQANHPSFLLNMDDQLSVYYANPEFYHVFGTDSETFAHLYHNRFRYTLTFQHQISQIKNMWCKLEKKGQYDGDLDIITASGGLLSLNFQVIRQKITETEEKLLGCFFKSSGECSCT